jgi:hypothetical protein
MFIRASVGTPSIMAVVAYAKIWHIFGQNAFLMTIPLSGERGKVRIAAYLLVTWMMGLGELETTDLALIRGFMMPYA